MNIEAQRIFHIYNRGNNKQPIFFTRDNYLFFLKKIRKHMLPYGNFLAWCLMPNHFHLMIEIEKVSTVVEKEKVRSLNDSIGIMLRSYTRAVNKEKNRTGALFQQQTKAKCLNDPEYSPAYFNTEFGMVGNTDIDGVDYLSACFMYILMNPVHHHLVETPSDWEFSSYLDLYGERKGDLIKVKRIKELGLTMG